MTTPNSAPTTDPVPATVSAWQALFRETSNGDLKLAMAASGTLLSAYTVVHMAGNMQVYMGRERFNAYAEFLRTAGAPVLPRTSVLWVARGVLSACALTHVMAGTELTLRAWKAEGSTPQAKARETWVSVKDTVGGRRRPRPRGRRRSVPQVIARCMRSTGGVLGLFTVYHVLDLTTGTRPAASREHVTGDAYGNLVASLSRPGTALFYAASMGALAGHMIHGLRTAAMDTGLTTTAERVRQVDLAAKAVGAAVAIGNLTIPAAVLTKVVR